VQSQGQFQWRVACVRIPRFPIGALWRAADGARDGTRQLALPLGEGAGVDAGPHWDERPLAVVEEQRLRAVTAAAGRRRVRAGMTVAEARASCADLEALVWDGRVVEQAITQATAALVLASPQVTPAAGAPGMWWVGAGGLDNVGGERGLVRTLWRVATLWHPRPRIAVADSCVAARAATWAADGEATEGGVTVVRLRNTTRDAADAVVGLLIPRGGCAAYLSRAPLTLLPLDDELRATLVALGIRTAGAFAALDPGEVERRWGAEGLIAWRLARGDDPRRPVLATLEASREVAAELATPADTLEPVLFLVRAALERLTSALASEGRAVAALAITLTLDDHASRGGALPAGGRPHTVTREVRLPRPIARTTPLFERCRALLERFTLEAPVVGVRTSITATAPAHGAQGDLLDARWRDPSAAEAAFERLRAELGPDVVVRAVAGDAFRPEGEGSWKDEEREPGTGNREPAAGNRAPGTGCRTAVPGSRFPVPASSDHASLRLLESPEAIEVECTTAGAPHALAWRGQRIAVLRAVGPERLSGDWWRDGYRRDYWRCAPAEGATVAGELLLYQDPAGAWHLQGWYD
jgi:protein ImuB